MKHLKIVTFMFFLILLYRSSIAQENKDFTSSEELKSEVKKSNSFVKEDDYISFVFGLEMGITKFADSETLEYGFNAGIAASDKIYAGIQFLSLSENAEIEIQNGGAVLKNFHTVFVGPYIEPFIFADKPVHIGFPIFIGLGGTEYEKYESSYADYYDWGYIWDDSYRDLYYVFKPGVEVEFNITSFFRIGVRGSIRYIYGGEFPDMNNNMLNNISGGFSFKFGKFKA